MTISFTLPISQLIRLQSFLLLNLRFYPVDYTMTATGSMMEFTITVFNDDTAELIRGEFNVD